MDWKIFFKSWGIGFLIGIIVLQLASLLLNLFFRGFIFSPDLFKIIFSSYFGFEISISILIFSSIIFGFLGHSLLHKKFLQKKINVIKLLCWMFIGFLVGGIVGFFVIAYFLSLIPHIDQGALLIFFTGPLGAIMGIYLATFIYLRKKK